jgi:ligand-binding SRPBCC domain-containing protein
MRIEVTTEINAPVERCFDLARNIDVHITSAGKSKEHAIAGRMHGLIALGETVTFQGNHFGLRITHTSKITAFEFPHYFQDSMLQGSFKSFVHDHRFNARGSVTIMTDAIEFEAPFGLLGQIACRLLVGPRLLSFLKHRNKHLKQIAESDDWKSFLVRST